MSLRTCSMCSEEYLVDDQYLIKFLLDDVNAKEPRRVHDDDAGYDLTFPEEVVCPAGKLTDVSCKLRLLLPPKVWGRITGRSSTFRKWRLVVLEGIIDTGYEGDIFVGVWNPNNEDVTVPAGARLAQIIFQLHVDTVLWGISPTSLIPRSARGTNGFGSSGI